MSDARRLVVVGSANLDIVVPVDHHPVRGETVLGGDHVLVPGGKGANQAVAAGRLGGSVSFVGRVGDDSAAVALRASLAAAGVELGELRVTADRPSGIALITVDAEGDNAIVVSPGANAALSPADVELATGLLADAAVTLLQLEVPMETVIAAAAHAGGIVVLDPAPAPPNGLPDALLGHVDVIVPNETELHQLTTASNRTEHLDELVDLARLLPVEQVVVTLGSRGALAVSGLDVDHVPAPLVTPVDTTAAGDSFRAALALCLMQGTTLVEACSFAVRVGAATTLRPGAQPSLPTLSELDELLDSR